METEDGLTIETLLKMPIFQQFMLNKHKTQYQYYQEKGSPPEILMFVELPGKTFGEKYMEQITRCHYNMEPRDDSGHDHRKLGYAIEEKSARYHANGGDWKWQHIEMKHPWAYLFLSGLDFHRIRNFIASRETVESLISMGIVTGQGKKSDEGVANAQQGYWFSRSDFAKHGKSFLDYFHEIKNEEELIQFITQQSSTHSPPPPPITPP